jgi:hypothetical protein
MELAVFKYIDIVFGAIHCCCLNSDYGFHGELVVGMSHSPKGFSSEIDEAVNDCVISLALIENFSETVEFEIKHKSTPEAALH